MTRETLVPLVASLAVVALIAGGVAAYSQHRASSEASEAEARRARREALASEDLAQLRAESAEILRTVIDGVALGMTLDEVRALRHTRMSESSTGAEPGLTFWRERMRNGGEIVYAFRNGDQRLEQVQVLSMMPTVEGIPPHLTAMHEAYGAPTGIWDCPRTGDVPTRRFTWRRAETALADIFLVHPGGVSLTLLVTTTERMQASLARSGCRPVDEADVEAFPMAEETPRPEEGGERAP